MPRVLVVLPTTSYRTADFVAAAATLGVELAVASDVPPPLDLGDHFVQVWCDDDEGSAEAMARLATTTPIDAIVAADDVGVVMTAKAAAKLGLPHNDPSAAAATRDKARMRAQLDAAEVPQPEFALLDATDDSAAVVAAFDGPVVVKPTGLSASRGVIRVDRPEDAADTVARVRRIQAEAGRSGPLLVERFTPGSEVAVEAIIWDGDLEVLAILDKPEPLDGPFFEETIFVTPSRHSAADQAQITDVTRRAAHALGLTHGPVHAEVRIHDGQATVIEIAARSIGGLCGRSLRFGLMGTSLEVMILRQALGMRKIGLRREKTAVGVLMVPIPGEGTLECFDGVEDTLAIPGVTLFEPAIPLGERVIPLPEGDRYLGFVFARAPHPDDVTSALRRARDTLVPRLA